MRFTFPSSSKEKQSGVTLLLAILILSSILAISFSLAGIMLIEVKSSGDLLRTEPALYAAQGVTEKGIFNLKRNTGVSLSADTIGRVSVQAPTQVYTAESTQTIRILPSTFDSTKNRYTFFTTATTSDYSRAIVKLLDTGNPGNLEVYFCQYDPVNDTDPCTQAAISPPTVLQTPGSDTWDSQLAFGLFDKYKHQELTLVNTSGADMYVVLQTFGPTALAPMGLPYFGEVALQVDASTGGVTRSIQTRVPTDTFVGVASSPVTFVTADAYDPVCAADPDCTTSSGTSGDTWETVGNYGTAGHNLFRSSSDTGNYPSWASVSISGASFYDWSTTGPDPGGDARALVPAGGGPYFIDTWFSSSSFTVDVNITDGNTHNISFYMVDWDSTTRNQRIDARDASSGNIVDTRTVSNFNSGVYYTYKVKGHVTFTFVNTGSPNAVLSAIFFQ